MPRTARGDTHNKLLHVYNRGCHKMKLFYDKQDYAFFLNVVKQKAEKHSIIIHEYCLMPNHYHFLLTPLKKDSLSKFMHGIGLIYAIYHHQKRKTHGHVWENRYKSKEVSSEQYYYELITYIENNPVRANLVKTPQQWKYSSKNKGSLNEIKILSKYNPGLELLDKVKFKKIYDKLPGHIRKNVIIGKFRSNQ